MPELSCYPRLVVRTKRLNFVLPAALVACVGLSLACATIPGFSAAPPDASDAAGNTDAFLSDVDASLPLVVDAGPDGALDADATKCTKCMIFITAANYFGSLVGSKVDTDKSCVLAAAQPNPPLPGKWTSLLWETNQPVPFSAINQSAQGWYQVGPGGVPGQQVLTSLTRAGRTPAPILTQFGQPLPDATVWTGGDELGNGLNCGNWKDPGAQGLYGDPNTGDWLAQGTSLPCGQDTKRIYCIQQTP